MQCAVGTASMPTAYKLKSCSHVERTDCAARASPSCHWYDLKSASAGAPFSSSSCSREFLGKTKRSYGHRCLQNIHVARGFGKDTVEGWIDLSKLVSGSGGIKTAYEDLAYKIGE